MLILAELFLHSVQTLTYTILGVIWATIKCYCHINIVKNMVLPYVLAGNHCLCHNAVGLF